MTKIDNLKKKDIYKTFKDTNIARVIYLLLDERKGKERGKMGCWTREVLLGIK